VADAAAPFRGAGLCAARRSARSNLRPPGTPAILGSQVWSCLRGYPPSGDVVRPACAGINQTGKDAMPGKRVQFDDETWNALDLLALRPRPSSPPTEAWPPLFISLAALRNF
jgi:hypothetical protein